MNEPAYSTVLEPARRILKICYERGFDTDPLNLMKLVYISHGWALALRDTPLFPEPVEAWRYGPVIRKLYQATKHFGRSPVVVGGLGECEEDASEFDVLLENVVDKYGEFGGIALSNLTHRNGTPWGKMYRKDRLGISIDNALIAAYYTDRLNDVT